MYGTGKVGKPLPFSVCTWKFVYVFKTALWNIKLMDGMPKWTVAWYGWSTYCTNFMEEILLVFYYKPFSD